MDVGLASDLDALLPLIAPLLSGHSDLAVGSRLTRGAWVVRGPGRELISHCFNRLLRLTFHNSFRDAQCGFKAGRADVVRALLPAVENDTRFFDTELLLAERNGLRIHEVPVDWVDDPDSRVAPSQCSSIPGRIGASRSGTPGRAGGHASMCVVFLLGLAASSVTLGVLHGVRHRPSMTVELAALLASGALATVIRFLLLRAGVFHPRRA